MNSKQFKVDGPLSRAVAEMKTLFDQSVRSGRVTDAASADLVATEIASDLAERLNLSPQDADGLTAASMKYGGDEFPPSDGG